MLEGPPKIGFTHAYVPITLQLATAAKHNVHGPRACLSYAQPVLTLSTLCFSWEMTEKVSLAHSSHSGFKALGRRIPSGRLVTWQHTQLYLYDAGSHAGLKLLRTATLV